MFLFGGPIPYLIKKYKLNIYDEEKEMKIINEDKNKCTKCLEYLEEKLFSYFVQDRITEVEQEKLKVNSNLYSLNYLYFFK